MVESLHSLFQNLATASTEQQLRDRLMDNLSEPFGMQRWGLYLLNDKGKLASFDAVGVSDRFVEKYEAIGKSVDPVLKYVLQYHAPAHEELVFPMGQWKQSQLYRRCCIEYDHEHIMTGPIVGSGSLVGTIHFARIGKTKTFDRYDLANLGAICLHLSACLAKLRSSDRERKIPEVKLTPREMQIANLVAKGLTNADIGRDLWITKNTVKQALKKMFIKLEVSSRTEMVVKLKNILDC